MKSSEFLIERVVNLANDESKEKYSAEVWDILTNSYKSIGGFKSARTPEDLIAKSGLWKLITRDGKVTAAFIYRDQFGRKAIAMGTDGTPQGKRDFAMIKDEDVKRERAWSEVSGAMEHIMKKAGAKPIPNKFATALSGKDIISYNPDGFHYTRDIQGHPHEKIIYGVVHLGPEEIQRFEAHGIDLHALPANIRITKH
jgi:hypothetical protein